MSEYESDKDNCFSDAREQSSQNRKSSVVDRRLGLDRRRGPGKRRTEDRRCAEEGQMSDEQFQFLIAIDEYKKVNQKPFPTWTEVLEVIKAMGYRKVEEPCSLDELQDSMFAEVKS
ncbi:MAG: hypothetical protein K8R02_09705 [Anaerohalosphaeraceae bacterium]|nr:hypothetical protein [Anaerohalosphaeraceae bacterium]